MTSNRWTHLTVIVLFLAGVASLSLLWPAPAPRIECGEDVFYQSKLNEALGLRGWAQIAFLHLAVVGFLLAWSLFYLQVGHWVLRRAAWAGVAGITFAATLGMAAVWHRYAIGWVDSMRTSCLETALADPETASYVAWSGTVLRAVLPSGSIPGWSSLLLWDAAVLALVAVMSGWLAYVGSRRALRF